jgi:membrane-bound serine protease (ClpP class)
MLVLPITTASAATDKVYVLRVDEFQTIDPGMANFTKRLFAQAEADPDAVAVVIVIDTPGGLVQSAFEMKDTILGSKLKTITWVKSSAISAGALIAVAGERFYMNPGSTIGAAEPRQQGSTEPPDPKVVSAVAAHFASAAQARGRDPKIARAFVDRGARIDGQTEQLLSLTYQEAIDKKFADGQAISIEEAVRLGGIEQYQLVEMNWTFRDRVGRWLTTPTIASLLLVGGIIAIGIEFMKPGVTLPGLAGVVLLGLFFAGNVLVGTAGWLELSLAIIGAVLLVVEAVVPGFGIFGIAGALAVGASIFLAVPSPELALRYLMYASVSFLVVLGALLRTIGQKGMGKALTLEYSLAGAQSSRTDLLDLVGKTGRATSSLRPGGSVWIGGERVDVISEGDYVESGTEVVVLRVEGTRVVVRPVSQ